MKASTRLVFLRILVFVTINILAQNGLEGKNSIYLQLGASGGYSPNLTQPILIPQLGLDATFGIIGLRATGQFFKTSPEFDINTYLDPIKSVLTISNLQEKNSNILLGFSPYLSFGKEALSIQPGFGLKYLMQKSATATAVYNQTPGTSILKFPDGDANRNLFVIEPNIRVSFGKPGDFLRFYLEAGYSIPQGSNEYTYTSRSITNVVDPRGNVDVKALLNSKEVITTEKAIPAFASVEVGIEIKLGEIEKDDYGIREAGLKSAEPVIQMFTSVNNFGVDENIKSLGELVAGAEISIKLEPSNTPVARVITDKNGEFSFDISEIPDFPEQGTFIFEVMPPKIFERNKKITAANKKINVDFVTPSNGKFKFLLFLAPSRGARKGGFAVSGRSGT